ncbi:3-oxoadipate enol-lactonase [Martelella sp. FLE1502]
MPFAIAPGGHINYRYGTAARSGAPCLLFINSLGTDLSMWDGVVEALGDRFATLGFDARGHGGSTGNDGVADIDGLVEDAIAVMDAAGVDKGVVVGLSLGGLTAQAMAIAHPDRVSALVLCATASAFLPAQMWRERAAATLENGSAIFAVPSMERWFTGGFRQTDPQTAQRLVAMVGETSDKGYADCCTVLAETDLSERLPAIACPALLVAGQQDAGCPPSVHETMRDRIPGARLVVLDPAAHMLAVERPDALAALIENFVESL